MLCTTRSNSAGTRAGDGRRQGLGGAEQLPALPSAARTPLDLGTAAPGQEAQVRAQSTAEAMCGSTGWMGPPLSLSSSLPNPILSLRTVPHSFRCHPAHANAVQLTTDSRPKRNQDTELTDAFVPLPLAASGTVGRSLAKPRSSGKCWLSDLARMCRKVDFPSTVLVVFSCSKAKQVRRSLCRGEWGLPCAQCVGHRTHRGSSVLSAHPVFTCMAIPAMICGLMVK